MICEKCGKSNPGGIEKCTYCGADMPETFICSGFADILTKQHTESSDGYPTTERISGNNSNMGVNEEDMKQILNNSEMTLKAAKKSSALAMMAVILCALTLVCSIVFGVMILSKGTSEQEAQETEQEQTKNNDTELPDNLTIEKKEEDPVETAKQNVEAMQTALNQANQAKRLAQEAVEGAQADLDNAKILLNAAEEKKKKAEDAYDAATDDKKAEFEKDKNEAINEYNNEKAKYDEFDTILQNKTSELLTFVEAVADAEEKLALAEEALRIAEEAAGKADENDSSSSESDSQ